MKKYKILLLILFIIIGINYSNAENKKNPEKDNFEILVNEFENNGFVISKIGELGYKKININNEDDLGHVIIEPNIKNNIYMSIEKYKSSNELNLKYLEKIDKYIYGFIGEYHNKYIKNKGLNISYQVLKKNDFLELDKNILIIKIYYKNTIFNISGPISEDYKKSLKIFLKGIKKFRNEKFLKNYGKYFVYSDTSIELFGNKIFIDLIEGIYIIEGDHMLDLDIIVNNVEKEIENKYGPGFLSKKNFMYFIKNYKIISEKKELNKSFVEKLVNEISSYKEY